MTPTIIAFGATGSSGGVLVERLLPDHAAGRVRLVATARRSEAAVALRQLGIDCRLVDLDHAEHLGLDPLGRRAVRGGPVFLATGDA